MFQTRQVHNGSLHLSAPSATFATLSLWLKNQCNVWFNLIIVCSIQPSLFPLSRHLSSKSKYPPLAESELEEKFIKGSGRGGQAVNKTNNCVQLTHKATGVVIKVSWVDHCQCCIYNWWQWIYISLLLFLLCLHLQYIVSPYNNVITSNNIASDRPTLSLSYSCCPHKWRLWWPCFL